MTSFLFLDNIRKKIKKHLHNVLNTFENITENGAFAGLCTHLVAKNERFLLGDSYD